MCLVTETNVCILTKHLLLVSEEDAAPGALPQPQDLAAQEQA